LGWRYIISNATIASNVVYVKLNAAFPDYATCNTADTYATK